MNLRRGGHGRSWRKEEGDICTVFMYDILKKNKENYMQIA